MEKWKWNEETNLVYVYESMNALMAIIYLGFNEQKPNLLIALNTTLSLIERDIKSFCSAIFNISHAN